MLYLLDYSFRGFDILETYHHQVLTSIQLLLYLILRGKEVEVYNPPTLTPPSGAHLCILESPAKACGMTT